MSKTTEETRTGQAVGKNRRPSEQAMADRAHFDSVAWGSHCVDCFPGACPYRVYVRDGRVVREEVAGTMPPFEVGVPDMNPPGCQKGAASVSYTHLRAHETR